MPKDFDPYDQPLARSEGTGMPTIENGTYEAEITDVVTPYADEFNPGREKFHVDYTLDDPDLEPNTWLRKYVNITDGILKGHVDPKSALYEVLESAGYNMDGKLPTIRQLTEALPGKRVQLTVKNTPPRNDPNGEIRPRIVAMMATRKRKEPVAAGARRGATATFEDDE